MRRLNNAKEHIEEGAFDIVLLALDLPDSQGLETLNYAATIAHKMPVIALANCNNETIVVKALRLGVQDYLIKNDIKSDLLKRSIRYAIERHRVRTQLRSLALIDDLTNLFNRRGFLALARHHLKLAQRTQKGGLLVYFDLDGLKKINAAKGQ